MNEETGRKALTAPNQRRVLIWRDEWLPPSETFIVNQLSAMQRWAPVPAALYLVSQALGLPAELVLTKRRRYIQPFVHLGGIRLYTNRLKRLVSEHGVELIHAHFGTGGVTILPLARRLRLPLVVTFHGFDATRLAVSRRPGAILYRRKLASLFRYSARLIAVSEYMREQLVLLGAPPEKVQVLPIGVPIEYTSEVATHQHPNTSSSDIVFVGRLVEKKGAADLLSAADELSKEIPGLTVTIIGSGPLRQELERQTLRQGGRVEFTGALSPIEVSQRLRTARIFCGPSRAAADGDAEGFGMVFLEAALHELPVVAYRHGGVEEAVEDTVTGLLAPEGDVVALRKILRELLTDAERARLLGIEGRKRVIADFDVVRRTGELEVLYDSVVAEGQPLAPPPFGRPRRIRKEA